MYRFMDLQGFADYDTLHRWSIDEPAAFWPALARFCGFQFDRAPERVLTQPGDMTTARWFEGGTLNFSRHLLRKRGEGAALIFCGENGVRRELSHDERYRQVAAVAAGLAAAGVGRGARGGGAVA
jgi:acetoacetyl-CoA synthetase